VEFYKTGDPWVLNDKGDNTKLYTFINKNPAQKLKRSMC